MIKKLIIGAIALFLHFGGHAQTPFVSYSFDGCDVSSGGQVGLDGKLQGSVDCVCGLLGESLELDGMGESIVFPPELSQIFLDDFTLDFYFSIDNVTEVTDILSYRNQCNTDSLMSLKYYPGNNELLLELAKNIAGYKSIVVTLPDRCWHRFTLTRNALVYTFYLNNKKVGTFLPDEQIPMSPSAQMAISGSPCQPVTESPFLGRVDEFNIYKEAVSEAFLRNTYLHPDEIITNDTTIFLGESVDIIFGQTCQSLVAWTPTDGLDDPNSLEPIATPLISTKYKVKTSDSNCASDSEVDIFVVDPDAFDCNDLLLPSAFTPNGDQLNDRFGISNRFIIQKIELFYIMDKWGNKVFETTSASDTWDGTYNGKRLPPGTYTYIINYSCQGSGFNKIGTVVLLS